MRLKYAFIKKHSTDYPVRRLCQTLKVHPSGYYAWLAEPQSARAKEVQRLLGLIKHAWLGSGSVYGYRKIHDDLRELGETCRRNRVGRPMQAEWLRSQTGYRRRPGFYGGKPTVASPNYLSSSLSWAAPVIGIDDPKLYRALLSQIPLRYRSVSDPLHLSQFVVRASNRRQDAYSAEAEMAIFFYLESVGYLVLPV